MAAQQRRVLQSKKATRIKKIIIFSFERNSTSHPFIWLHYTIEIPTNNSRGFQGDIGDEWIPYFSSVRHLIEPITLAKVEGFAVRQTRDRGMDNLLINFVSYNLHLQGVPKQEDTPIFHYVKVISKTPIRKMWVKEPREG